MLWKTLRHLGCHGQRQFGELFLRENYQLESLHVNSRNWFPADVHIINEFIDSILWNSQKQWNSFPPGLGAQLPGTASQTTPFTPSARRAVPTELLFAGNSVWTLQREVEAETERGREISGKGQGHTESTSYLCSQVRPQAATPDWQRQNHRTPLPTYSGSGEGGPLHWSSNEACSGYRLMCRREILNH